MKQIIEELELYERKENTTQKSCFQRISVKEEGQKIRREELVGNETEYKGT